MKVIKSLTDIVKSVSEGISKIEKATLGGALCLALVTPLIVNKNAEAYILPTRNSQQDYQPAQVTNSPSLEELRKEVELIMQKIEAENAQYLQEQQKQPQISYASRKRNSGELQKNFLTDEFFRDIDYIGSDEVRNLLEEKNSCLKGRGIEQRIIGAAKEYNINPLLLLARLQVEKTLITKQRAKPQDIKYGMGFGCFDNGKKLKSSSIDSQIENAARILNEHYDSFVPGKPIRIDYGKRTIVPECAAVYALLKYTPHTSGYHLNKRVIQDLASDLSN